MPFHIDAWVVLPDHMHTIWTLPAGDTDFPMRWLEIKKFFSRHVATSTERTPSQICKRERGVWQRRFWEHTIRDEQDYAAHMDYIHFNPVRHGLVEDALAWRYSSLRRCIAAGVYPAGWSGGAAAPEETGEWQTPFHLGAATLVTADAVSFLRP